MPLHYTITKAGKIIYTTGEPVVTNDDNSDSDKISKQAALLAKVILRIRSERSLSPIQPTIYSK
jgi:hypothetical protein